MELRKDSKQWIGVGCARDQPFSGKNLPTNRDVIGRFLYYLKIKKYTLKKSLNASYEEVIAVWKKVSDGATPGYTCYMSRKTVLKKLTDLYDMLKKAEDAKSAQSHREKWISYVDKLFDIAKDDVKEHLCDKDYKFLLDQKGPRQATFGGKDVKLRKQIKRRISREESAKKRQKTSKTERELLRKVVDSSSLCLSSASSETSSVTSNASFFDFENRPLSHRNQPAPDFVELKIPRKIANSPEVVAAIDRHKLSPNAFNDVFAAIVRASGGDLNDFIISSSTTSRAAKSVRKKTFEKVKTDFKTTTKDEFVSIHWDEKLMKERGDFTPMEHIAVLASHRHGTKLLGTTSVEKGTGKNQAEAIKNILCNWDLEKQCVAMCFDTTASNTGKFNGACILLEALLDHPLLWTACRHHVHEVILSQVFKSLFGKSSSPQITIFEDLKKKWLHLDFAADMSHISNSAFEMDPEELNSAYELLHDVKYDTDSYIPRDDYAELLDLVLFYLKKESFDTFRFKQPGSQHRARWMSSAIYTMKMLLLQTQLKLGPKLLYSLQLFGYFVAVIYAPSWFKAPVAREAAVNDLKLYKSLLSHQKKEVFRDMSVAAISALQRHLWYLCEELIPFALCSSHLHDHTKEALASKLFRVYQQFFKTTLFPQKPLFPSISESTKIENLVGERSVIIFQRFKFSVDDVQFLRYSSAKWDDFESFRKFKGLVSTLHVTNDLAERGIKILEDYKEILTEDAEQRQLILHCVEQSRKERPDFLKSTLACSSSSL